MGPKVGHGHCRNYGDATRRVERRGWKESVPGARRRRARSWVSQVLRPDVDLGPGVPLTWGVRRPVAGVPGGVSGPLLPHLRGPDP